MESVQVQYISDALCIWAYISEKRIEELQLEFEQQVVVAPHFVNVYGDVHGKIEGQWAKRGGQSAYAKTMHKTAKKFEHLEIHPEAWFRFVPRTSLSAHVFLSAVGVVDETRVFETLKRLRRAFYVELRDLSSPQIQMEVAEELGLSREKIEAALVDGRAHARMAGDLKMCSEQNIKMSPTLLFNEGRQRLTGNVGYRVIEANIRELLSNPPEEASWC